MKEERDLLSDMPHHSEDLNSCNSAENVEVKSSKMAAEAGKAVTSKNNVTNALEKNHECYVYACMWHVVCVPTCVNVTCLTSTGKKNHVTRPCPDVPLTQFLSRLRDIGTSGHVRYMELGNESIFGALVGYM